MGMDPKAENGSRVFTEMEIDVIGEILNISMGSAATALSSMLDKQVLITTPKVVVEEVSKIDCSKLEPAMMVKITYDKGITGSNIMVFRQRDMQYILNQLMGIEGPLRDDYVFDDLSISAACEVMNQMMGSSATALSEFLGRSITISTPTAFIMDDENTFEYAVGSDTGERVVAIFFNLSIEDVVNSEFVCVMQSDLAHAIVSQFVQSEPAEPSESDQPVIEAPQAAAAEEAPPIDAAHTEQERSFEKTYTGQEDVYTEASAVSENMYTEAPAESGSVSEEAPGISESAYAEAPDMSESMNDEVPAEPEIASGEAHDISEPEITSPPVRDEYSMTGPDPAPSQADLQQDQIPEPPVSQQKTQPEPTPAQHAARQDTQPGPITAPPMDQPQAQAAPVKAQPAPMQAQPASGPQAQPVSAPSHQGIQPQSSGTGEVPGSPYAQGYAQQPPAYHPQAQGYPGVPFQQGAQYPPQYPYPQQNIQQYQYPGYPPQMVPQFGQQPAPYGQFGPNGNSFAGPNDPADKHANAEPKENAVIKQAVNVRNVQFPTFSAQQQPMFSEPLTSGNIDMLMNIPLNVSIEIGRTKKKIKDIMDFNQGSIIELEKQAGAPVDIIVNGQLMARGDVVVIDDNFAVRITEIVGTKEIIGSADGSAGKV